VVTTRTPQVSTCFQMTSVSTLATSVQNRWGTDPDRLSRSQPPTTVWVSPGLVRRALRALLRFLLRRPRTVFDGLRPHALSFRAGALVGIRSDSRPTVNDRHYSKAGPSLGAVVIDAEGGGESHSGDRPLRSGR